MIIVCYCENRPFNNSYNGHIIAGDLRIIKDNKLKNVFATKDPKYREPRKTDFDQSRQNIVNGSEACISTWNPKHGMSGAILLESKNKVI